MFNKELSIIKKIENAGDSSIDYYSNICRNYGGTTSEEVPSIAVKDVTAPGINLFNFNTLIRYNRPTYRYIDFSDLVEYERRIATDELTSSPVIMRKIAVGEQEIKEGKKISWREVYRKS